MQQEFPFALFLAAFAAYTALVFVISWLSGRGSGEGSGFFAGDRKAPWPVVAYGMIGASISGVTFISVPGNVWAQNFFYMPLVLGFVGGYIVIAKVLLPLYYKMNLTSIYGYLGERFGSVSHKTGTTVFLVSRVLGAAVRIFVVMVVLFAFIPSGLKSSSPLAVFALVTAVFLTLLYLYTYRGGVRTIIWTDVLQTTFMLLAVGLTICFICKDMGWSFTQMLSVVGGTVNENSAAVGYGHSFTSWFDWDRSHGTNAIKQFVSGIFVTIAMTGLDQTMMQKNLSCKNLKSAQKNMYTTSIIIVVVNLFFVLLGALLCVYAQSKGISFDKTDTLFPTVASQYLGVGVGVFFLIGLVSASYPSAGAALTGLTSSFCVDYLNLKERSDWDDARKERVRKTVHACVALVFLLIIIVLQIVSSDAVVNLVYKLASYTYGPLLGMFFFGILTRCEVRDRAVPFVAVAAPLLCLALNLCFKAFLGFDLGFSLLIVNGLLTFFGMWLCRKK